MEVYPDFTIKSTELDDKVSVRLTFISTLPVKRSTGTYPVMFRKDTIVPSNSYFNLEVVSFVFEAFKELEETYNNVDINSLDVLGE